MTCRPGFLVDLLTGDWKVGGDTASVRNSAQDREREIPQLLSPGRHLLPASPIG